MMEYREKQFLILLDRIAVALETIAKEFEMPPTPPDDDPGFLAKL